MSDNTSSHKGIYLAPQPQMDQEQFDSANKLLNALMVASYKAQLNRGSVNLHEAVALSYANFALLENLFDCFRKILIEAIDASPKVSGYLFQLTSSIKAFHSILQQMHLLYLNTWSITEGIFDDGSLTDAVVSASDIVVEQNTSDVRNWLDDELTKRGLPLPPIQLELELGLGHPV